MQPALCLLKCSRAIVVNALPTLGWGLGASPLLLPPLDLPLPPLHSLLFPLSHSPPLPLPHPLNPAKGQYLGGTGTVVHCQ